MRTSIILPTKGHSKQAVATIDRLLETVAGLDVEIVVVAYPDDDNAVAFATINNDEVRVIWDGCGRMEAWNVGAAASTGDYLHGSSDDHYYEDNWLHNALEVHKQVNEEQGCSDIYVKIPFELDCYWAEVGVGSREFFQKHMGGVIVIPHYKAIYSDVELSDRAISANALYHSPNSKIRHDWNGPHAVDVQDYDKMIYDYRKEAGFPNDFPPVL